MLYRGFRIANESTGSSVSFVIYETHRAHWRKIASANAVSVAERLVDDLLLARERLFGQLGGTPARR
jgi:hypothetical protein